MIRGYAVAQVRAAEDQVRAGLPEGELMQRAARGLAEVVLARAQERDLRRVVVLVGPGDNGGDALLAADRLAADLDVTVLTLTEALTAQAREALAAAEIVVDGMLGIGGRPGLTGVMAEVVRHVPETAYVVAVDLPSGADPEGSQRVEAAVTADETVTFGLVKPVHLLPAASTQVGRLTVVDIGVATDARPAVESLESADVAALWPVPGPTDHKYTRGVLAVVAGSATYPGAAVLATTAAVESGVGMVRYLGPRRAEDLVLAASPEVVPGEGRVQAAVVGPGVSSDDAEQAERIRALLASDTPLVVDAGALEILGAWLTDGHHRGAPTLLTPHAGELATLLTTLGQETDREAVEADPMTHARTAAARTGATVLLKGATTLVVDPDAATPARAQADAPAWLATAGAGDVLAGIAGTLLAAGLTPLDAGSLAALVHGRAAHHANPGGPVRALAVAHAIPATVAGLLRAEETTQT